MTSTLRPSPSAPIFTNLKIQATRSPRVKDRPETCSHGVETPKLAAVPYGFGVRKGKRSRTPQIRPRFRRLAQSGG
jgi:hypothetical protein